MTCVRRLITDREVKRVDWLVSEKGRTRRRVKNGKGSNVRNWRERTRKEKKKGTRRRGKRLSGRREGWNRKEARRREKESIGIVRLVKKEDGMVTERKQKREADGTKCERKGSMEREK